MANAFHTKQGSQGQKRARGWAGSGRVESEEDNKVVRPWVALAHCSPLSSHVWQSILCEALCGQTCISLVSFNAVLGEAGERRTRSHWNQEHCQSFALLCVPRDLILSNSCDHHGSDCPTSSDGLSRPLGGPSCILGSFPQNVENLLVNSRNDYGRVGTCQYVEGALRFYLFISAVHHHHHFGMCEMHACTCNCVRAVAHAPEWTQRYRKLMLALQLSLCFKTDYLTEPAAHHLG